MGNINSEKDEKAKYTPVTNSGTTKISVNTIYYRL